MRLELGNLVLPEVICQWVRGDLGEDIFFLLVAPEAVVAQLLGEAGIGHATTQGEVAVNVAYPFPGIDGRQMRRLLGGGEPLRDREVGRAAHRHLAGAPVLYASHSIRS